MRLYFLVILAVTGLGLPACQPNATDRSAVPDACALLSTDLLGEILREPVRKPTEIDIRINEWSACTYTLPGQSRGNTLGIFVFPPAPTQDMRSLKQVADEWKTRNAGADYEVLDNDKYPMASFPGMKNTYPTTFIILFKKMTLVITGTSVENAQSIAFRAMVDHSLE